MFHCRAVGMGRDRDLPFLVVEFPFPLQAVYPIRLFVVPIVGQLILHIEKDEDTAGHPHGKARDVDGRESLVPDQIPEGDLEIVLQHGLPPFLDVKASIQILRNDAPVEEVDRALGKIGIGRGMGHHNDGCPRLMEHRQHPHDLFTVG